ncbi:hypothetical protein SPRG_15126 [Saprolegnia parasitica CBS 223.65]|uniref:Uncharacterized protein n=1 Tax=Saprolegnia parasitica (strain CBS 223.65) TaxID=695850 RepID=A0A067BRF6_SAPPC|nr:hypothetical protein SPRG_15126 [Saprolegnia parasitica CBS 223.65]KDO19385.1 hypothetical protein SPRG_15126 [Saprolegnia parasitica CBS 223.65]|eukprot:XP_012209889.1 hypothetical protein SPRG_15126 [Saprolegnia parasitica CBS 223.65]
MADVDPAVLKRRQYLRIKQMHYRSKIAGEITALKAEVDVLQKQLARQLLSPTSRALPWAEIATALDVDNKEKLKKRKMLQLQHASYLRLVGNMRAWVTRVLPVRHTTTSVLSSYTKQRAPVDPPWRRTYLPLDANTRKLAIDWLTQLLLHNTDNMLAKYEFDALDPHAYSIDFAMSLSPNDLFEYVWRTQKELPLPMEVVSAALRRWMQQYTTGSVWTDVQSSELLQDDALETVQGATYAHTVRENPTETVNFLTREFQPHADRVVFVGQNIHHDERVSSSVHRRNRMFWYVVDRVGPTTTRFRNLDVLSHFFTDHGPVSLDVEANLMGFTTAASLSEMDMLAAYTRHATAVYRCVGQRSDETLFALLDGCTPP